MNVGSVRPWVVIRQRWRGLSQYRPHALREGLDGELRGLPVGARPWCNFSPSSSLFAACHITPAQRKPRSSPRPHPDMRMRE